MVTFTGQQLISLKEGYGLKEGHAPHIDPYKYRPQVIRTISKQLSVLLEYIEKCHWQG